MNVRTAPLRRAVAGGTLAVAVLLTGALLGVAPASRAQSGGDLAPDRAPPKSPAAPPPPAPGAALAAQGPGTPAPATPAAAPPGVAPPGAGPGNPGDAAGPAATEDIRDIRGPKHVANPWLIAELIAGLVVLAIAGYGLLRWRTRRKRPRVLLPFERALEGLEALRPLMQPAQAREFSIAATDIVRGYIEERFRVIATHRTTEEFLHDLLDSPNASLVRHRGLLAEFLNQTDLVKFAGVSLSATTMETLHDSARAFVLETAKPDPEPVPEAKAATAAAPANAAKPATKTAAPAPKS